MATKTSRNKGHRGGGRSRSPYPKPHPGGPYRDKPEAPKGGPATGTGSGSQKSQSGGNLAKGFGGK